MSFTNITLVRNHLYRLNVGAGEVRDCAVKLAALDYVSLPHAHIAVGSETVKALETSVPVSETVILGDEPVTLSHIPVVTDTLVCAGDSSLSRIYQENSDYAVDYPTGQVQRLDTGAIPDGAEATVWYLYFHVFLKGVDYYFDYERGRLRRLTSGGIAEGREVLVDYRLGTSEFSDAEIEQCIDEADAEIGHLIDPAFSDSTDPALQTAATCLALSILCRNSAGMTASGSAGNTAGQASLWMELAQSYRQTADRLLAWFRSDSSTMRPPQLS